MRTNFSFNSTHFKNICIGIFFIVLSVSVLDLSKFTKGILGEMKAETKELITTQSNSLRADTFKFLYASTDKIDRRVGSIQSNLDTRLKSFETVAESHLTTIENRSFKTLDNLDSNISVVGTEFASLSGEYKKVPRYLSLFDKELDCTKNEFCWQNLTTDSLLSVRNVSVDANKTFITLNESIPIWSSDFTKLSSSISTGVPQLVDNTTKFTANAVKLTNPSWASKLLSYGVGGSMIYLNLRR